MKVEIVPGTEEIGFGDVVQGLSSGRHYLVVQSPASKDFSLVDLTSNTLTLYNGVNDRVLYKRIGKAGTLTVEK